MPTIAVLDACVLVPAALRDTLLRAAEFDLYSARWSEEILVEVERSLVADGMTSADRARRLIAAMQRAFPQAMVSGYETMIASMTNDQKDRHVVAAAVIAGADVVVTQNLRDFPSEALEPWGVEAISPDRFLTSLYDEAPELLRHIVQSQASDLRNPPLTVADVLISISSTAPTFADLAGREPG